MTQQNFPTFRPIESIARHCLRTVEVRADETADVHIRLTETTSELDEVVVTAIGVWVNMTSGHGHMTAIRQLLTTDPVYLFLENGVPTRSTGFFNHNALYETNVQSAVAGPFSTSMPSAIRQLRGRRPLVSQSHAERRGFRLPPREDRRLRQLY